MQVIFIYIGIVFKARTNMETYFLLPTTVCCVNESDFVMFGRWAKVKHTPVQILVFDIGLGGTQVWYW